MSDALAEGKTRAANHRGKVGARVHPHGLGLGLGGGHGLLLSGYPNNAGAKVVRDGDDVDVSFYTCRVIWR